LTSYNTSIKNNQHSSQKNFTHLITFNEPLPYHLPSGTPTSREELTDIDKSSTIN